MLRTTSRLALGGVIAVLLSLPSLRADVFVPPLERPVTVFSYSGSLPDYLLGVFRIGGIPGGIAIVNDRCEDILVQQLPEINGTVQEALEKVASTGHQLHWLQDGERLVVYNTPSAPRVLATVVRKFKFSRQDPLTLASSTLFDTPEARDQVKALHLIEYGPELGFAQLPPPRTRRDVVSLANTTVLNALNQIAGDHAVWLYNESTCEKGKKGVMSLNWPTR
jgi:hypothetical protein